MYSLLNLTTYHTWLTSKWKIDISAVYPYPQNNPVSFRYFWLTFWAWNPVVWVSLCSVLQTCQTRCTACPGIAPLAIVTRAGVGIFTTVGGNTASCRYQQRYFRQCIYQETWIHISLAACLITWMLFWDSAWYISHSMFHICDYCLKALSYHNRNLWPGSY